MSLLTDTDLERIIVRELKGASECSALSKNKMQRSFFKRSASDWENLD
jgi:hypothetical protein